MGVGIMVKRAMVMSFMAKVFAIHIAQSHLVVERAVRFNEPIRRLVKFMMRIMMAMWTMVTSSEEFSVMIPQLNWTSKTTPHDGSEGGGRLDYRRTGHGRSHGHWCGHRRRHRCGHWTRSIGSGLLLVHWSRRHGARRRIHSSRGRLSIRHGTGRWRVHWLGRRRGVHWLGRRRGVHGLRRRGIRRGCSLRHTHTRRGISNGRSLNSGDNHRCRLRRAGNHCC
jgi:hypothetical protein